MNIKESRTVENEKKSGRGTDANRDPITGTPGAHPVGTGVGAAGGAAAGAAIGAAAGPVGAAVGLVTGAVVGGLAGKGVAEKIDPTVEDAYGRENYVNRPYVERGTAYEAYQPAYRTSYEGRTRYPGKTYEQVEADLQRDYEKAKGSSTVAWDRAKNATRDAWHRVERAFLATPMATVAKVFTTARTFASE
jgi:phage tail tape-measure protein